MLILFMAMMALAQNQDQDAGGMFETVPPPPSVESSVQRLQSVGNGLRLPTYASPETSCNPQATPAPARQRVPARCEQATCRFSSILNSKSGSGRGNCISKLLNFQDQHSPWAGLSQFDRFKLTMQLAKRHAGKLDTRMTQNSDWSNTKAAFMTCIGARETGGRLEPLSISFSNCYGTFATQAGLGAQVRRYYDVAVKGVNGYRPAGFSFGTRQRVPFVSSIPRYKNDQASVRNYENLTTDPELQLEFMDYFLSSIAANTKNRLDPHSPQTLEYLAARYNGSRAKNLYGRAVANCTSCVLHLTEGGYTPDQVKHCMLMAVSNK